MYACVPERENESRDNVVPRISADPSFWRKEGLTTYASIDVWSLEFISAFPAKQRHTIATVSSPSPNPDNGPSCTLISDRGDKPEPRIEITMLL